LAKTSAGKYRPPAFTQEQISHNLLTEASSRHVAPSKQINYWLMKSEAECFSYDDLATALDKTTCWDGVRNFEARNMMRDLMKKGDLVLYYHSKGNPPGVAGVAKIVRDGYPDSTAFDKKDRHFDAKSDPAKPTWYMVDVKAVKKFKNFVSINDLRSHPLLQNMALFKRNRLSVTAVTPEEFDEVCNLGDGHTTKAK